MMALPRTKRTKDALRRNVNLDFERDTTSIHQAPLLYEQLLAVPIITDFVQFSIFIGEFIDARTLFDLRYNSMEIKGNFTINDERIVIYNHVRGGVSLICLPGDTPYVMNRRISGYETLSETFFTSAVKVPLNIFQYPEGPIKSLFSSVILSETDFCADCNELDRKCFVFPYEETKCRYCNDPTDSNHPSRLCPFFADRFWKHSLVSAETCSACAERRGEKYRMLTWRANRKSLLLLAEEIVAHEDATNFLLSAGVHKNIHGYPNFYEPCPENWFPTVLHDKTAAFQILLDPGHLPLIGWNYNPAHCFCELGHGLFEGATIDELRKAIRIVRKFNTDYQFYLIHGTPILREYDDPQKQFRGTQMKASDFLCFREEWAYNVENIVLYDLDFEKYKLQQMRSYREAVPSFFATTPSYNLFFQGPRPTPTACYLKYRDTSESSAEDSDFTMDHSHVYMQDVTVTPTTSRSSSGVSSLTSDDEQGEAATTGMPHA